MSARQSKYIWIFLHLPKTGGTTFLTHLEKNFKYDEEFIHVGAWGDKYRKNNNKIPFEKRTLNERSKAIVIGGHAAYYGIHKLVPNKIPRYIIFLRDPGSWMVSTFNYQLALTPDMKKSFKEFSDWYYNYNTRYIQEFLRSKYIRGLEKSGSLYTIKRRFKKFSRIFKVYFIYDYLLIKGNRFQYLRAKRLLNKCFFIGILDHLDDDLAILFDLMGIDSNFVSVNITSKNKNQKIKKSSFTSELNIDTRVKLNQQIQQDCETNSNYDLKLYLYGKQLNNEFKKQAVQ